MGRVGLVEVDARVVLVVDVTGARVVLVVVRVVEVVVVEVVLVVVEGGIVVDGSSGQCSHGCDGPSPQRTVVTTTWALASTPISAGASVQNATDRPSAEIEGLLLRPITSCPSSALIRTVLPVWRSCTNTSDTWFPSLPARLDASLSKTT